MSAPKCACPGLVKGRETDARNRVWAAHEKDCPLRMANDPTVRGGEVKKRRKATTEERIYRALFGGGASALARPTGIWPSPRSEILATIRRAIEEGKK